VLLRAKLAQEQRISTLPSWRRSFPNSPRRLLADLARRTRRQVISGPHRPSEISLLEVVEAIDGRPIYLNECVADKGTAAFLARIAPLRPVWCEAQAKLVEILKVHDIQPRQHKELAPAD